MLNRTLLKFSALLILSFFDSQVVNGFFWEGKPVGNLNSETSHSAALGVSCLNRLFFLLVFLCLSHAELQLTVSVHLSFFLFAADSVRYWFGFC